MEVKLHQNKLLLNLQMFAFLAAILSFALILTGCGTLTKKSATPAASDASLPPKPPTPERLNALNNVNSWHIKGKIAVHSSRDSGSATVDWLQKGGQYYVSLLGPLGSNGMKLSGGSRNVTLKTSDGKTYHSSSPEQLLAERWGFNLPVSNMRYWIRGLPVPNIASQKRYDGNGRLTQLLQQGWSIQYQNYQPVSGVDLPDRIAISSPALQVKIVVYQWSLG